MKLLRSFFFLLTLATAAAQTFPTPQTGGVSKAADGTHNITADLAFGTGRTQTFRSGSTLSLLGTLSGTPTGGTLNLSAVTLTLGAITPASVNGVTLSGSSTPTLAVTGTTAISGTNTGDNAVNSLYSGLVSNATHTGDATGSTTLTLATVNANVGGFGSATAAPTFTVNAKGLITAAGSATITPAVGSITGLGTGIATALAINTGNSGAPVLIDGALGTPTSGVGTNLTALNATQLTSGTVPDARFPATLPAASGVNLTALNATNLGSGTVPDARFPATLPAASGVNLTALNATNLGSGTVPAARFPALTGEATTSAGAVAVTLTNSAVIGKVLTGYTSGAGTVAATDTILQAVQKLNGNAANLQPLDAELTAISGLAANGLIARTSASTAAARTLTGTAAEITVTNGDGVAGNPTLSLPAALNFTGKTITGGTFASPNLTTPTIGAGSAAAPALSFSGDQDTGLYHIGANNLGVAAGGAKVLDVATTGLGVTGALSSTTGATFATSSGNVGIGTSSTESGFKLHVTGNGFFSQSSGTVGKAVVDTADNRLVLGSYFEAGVGQYSFISSTNNAETGNIPLLFQTGTTERMRITDAGNVGINISSPAARFDVSGSAAFGVGSTTGFGITFREHTSGTVRNWVLRDDAGIDRLRFARGASDAVFWDVLKVAASDQTANQIWYTNGAERMQLSTSGLDVTGGLTTTNGITSVFNNGTAQGINIRETTDATNANFVVFRKSNSTAIGSITRVTTTDAVAYNTTSDARLKTNIRDFTAADAARIIDGLRPRWFDWKSGDLTESVEETIDTGKKDSDGKAITEKRQKQQKVKDAARTARHIADNKSIIGFIAQEEAAVDPALVRAGAVTVGDDDPTTITRQWARSDAALVPVLVAELKSLRARVAQLEAENQSLDARMAAVEALLKPGLKLNSGQP